MTVPLRAALYLRVPTVRQAEHDVSIPDQRKQGEAYCQARGALWNEIDMDARVWAIPANRMKASKPHRVPLCDEAMAILALIRQWRLDGCAFVFPGPRGGLLSDVAINKTLHAVAAGVNLMRL